MKSSFFSGLKWKIDTGSGAPTKEEVEREVAVLCLCPRLFPEAYFPKWRAAKCSGNVLEGALFFLFPNPFEFFLVWALSNFSPFCTPVANLFFLSLFEWKCSQPYYPYSFWCSASCHAATKRLRKSLSWSSFHTTIATVRKREIFVPPSVIASAAVYIILVSIF